MTTRAERIRAWLATQTLPASARDVLLGIEPRGDINAICSTLAQMEKAGTVQAGKVGTRRYYVIGDPPKPKAPRPPGPARTRKPMTGRANRLREFLQEHDRGFTVAELRAAVDPRATSNQVSASLHTLVKQKHAHRAIQGRLASFARTAALAQAQLAAEVTRERAAAPTPKPVRQAPVPKPKAEPKPRAKRPAPSAPKAARTRTAAPPTRELPRALPSPPPPSPAMRAAMDASACNRPRGRPAPVSCGLDGVSERQRQASDRIAADIAAFEAKGGRIQRLGPTQFFTRIGMEAANHVPPRAPRTGTTDLDD
jgi:hypothetical protein